jgi:hypothetical protein
MYVATLKVAKDCKTLTSGPKFAGMANFGDVKLSKSMNEGGCSIEEEAEAAAAVAGGVPGS